MPSLRQAIAAKASGEAENPILAPKPGQLMLDYALDLGFMLIGDETMLEGREFIEGPDLCRMMNSAQREAMEFEMAKKPKGKK